MILPFLTSLLLISQVAGMTESAPRAPDQKVISYEVYCERNSVKMSYRETFKTVRGDELLVRSVSLSDLRVRGSRPPKVALVKAIFQRMAYVKSVTTSCKGNAAWFVVDYIAQSDFKEALRKDLSVHDTAPLRRLYLTVERSGSLTIEDALPRTTSSY